MNSNPIGDILIGFKTAKLAKECNFNEPCKLCFDDTFEIPLPFNNNEIHFNSKHPYYSACTQSFLRKWLRDRFDIHITIEPDFYTSGINYLWQVLIYDKDSDYRCTSNLSIGQYGDNAEYPTYEDALEAALYRGLELTKELSKQKILSFDKPKQLLSKEEHDEKYSSDSGIPGTYVPNMSEEDKLKWKAKHIKGEDERIEIRKTCDGVQLLIIVYKEERNTPGSWRDKIKNHKNIKITMNGRTQLSFSDYDDMKKVIDHAKQILGIDK